MIGRQAPWALVAVVMAWLAVPAARADVQFSIRDGRVVLVATNATIADILAEWAKVGKTQIVNADKIPKDVVTLELRNVSERQVLDILLRSTSGFIVGLRDVGDPTASLFDRIVIMPPSAPPVVNASAAPARTPSPVAAPALSVEEPPMAQVPSAPDRVDDAPPPVLMGSELPAPPDPTFTSNNTRHMMETIDPRTYRLPPGAIAITTPTGAMQPVVTSGRPGVIARPPPNSP